MCVCVCLSVVGGKPFCMCLTASRSGGHLEEALPCTQKEKKKKKEEFRPEISSSEDITGFH